MSPDEKFGIEQILLGSKLPHPSHYLRDDGLMTINVITEFAVTGVIKSETDLLQRLKND